MVTQNHTSSIIKSTTIRGALKWCIVFGILAAILFCFGRSGATSRRALIVNCDDAGMCSSANKGTISAFQSGILKSASIMTCCPGFEEFAEFARNNSQYDFGVHLTLTCDLQDPGWGPVLSSTEVSSLVGKNGLFHSNKGAVAESADLAEVELELRAQIQKAIDAGIRVSHFDHHMFVLHSRPDLLRLYVKLGIEFRVPVRFVRELPPPFVERYGQSGVNVHAEMRSLLAREKMPILDHLETDNYMVSPLQKREYFLNCLRTLPNGVTELSIHCASPDDSGIEPPDAEARFIDTVCFSSAEFKNEISRLRIEMIDWKEFKNWK